MKSLVTQRIVEYSPEHLEELVPMWRESFERAVGVADPHPIDEQRRYFETHLLPTHHVRVAIDERGHVVGFIAYTADTVAQLYVRVDRQGCGVGSRLLAEAKAESGGRLRLFTFVRNSGAREFYRRQGFREIRYGFEEEWQLEDVELEWVG